MAKLELGALKNLLKRKNIIVQKIDKGNAANILSRKDYVCKMKSILNDRPKV